MFGRAKIGKGRMAVKRKLESLRDEDASLPADARKYRTLTQEFFKQLCTETGGVSNPALLLDYLHHVGMVFYRKGLFDDCIVLDQEWGMQAVYAVFQHKKCYRQIRDAHGRFTRSLLDALVWGEYSVEEQEIFLSLMTSCGICFIHREEDPKRGIETEYIAPDLLPGREEVAMDIDAMWRDETPRGELEVKLPFLHPGILRDHQPDRERSGYRRPVLEIRCVFVRRDHPQPRTHRAAVARDSHRLERPDPRQHARRPALELLERLKKWIGEELARSGCQNAKLIEPTANKPRSARTKKASPHRIVKTEPEDKALAPTLEFRPPPSDTISYCVSYAWNDESKALVDRLCEQAKQRGITILRDIDGLRLGASITRFMQGLAKGDRVFVILSDKYLKSPNCMYELMQVWRNCEMEPEVLREPSGSIGRRMPP